MERHNTACFTGHRPGGIGGYRDDNPTRQAVRQALFHMINLAVYAGVEHFIAGMAQGVDMDAAALVLEKQQRNPHIHLHAAIPCNRQEHLWPASAQECYHSLLKRCASITVISPGAYAAWKMQRRNEWMVDHSGTVIAVWNGTSGGTANCLIYALQTKQDFDLHWYNPTNKLTTTMSIQKGGQ